MKYYLIAGEASGDLHASRLMQALRRLDAHATFRGLGGDAMQAEGADLVCHYRQLAFMGFLQVAAHLPQILSGLRRCKRDIAQWRPDVVVLVDYPGFNLRVARWLKARHPAIRVAYYISPKIWAWKERRLQTIRRCVDLMLSILPFEVEWYGRRDYAVRYVGNPTVDELAPILAQPFDREAFCQRHGLNSNQSIIALLPGSRAAEVSANLPVMLRAATSISCHQLVVAGAPGLSPDFYAPILERHKMVPPVRIVFGETYDIVRAAEVAAVTSGTATLETAYLRTPQVVCYHMGGGMMFYRLMRRVLRHIRYISLVNLLVDAPAVTELIGPYLTPERLHDELLRLTGDSHARQTMLEAYAHMADLLGQPGAPDRAARLIVDLASQAPR